MCRQVCKIKILKHPQKERSANRKMLKLKIKNENLKQDYRQLELSHFNETQRYGQLLNDHEKSLNETLEDIRQRRSANEVIVREAIGEDQGANEAIPCQYQNDLIRYLHYILFLALTICYLCQI